MCKIFCIIFDSDTRKSLSKVKQQLIGYVELCWLHRRLIGIAVGCAYAQNLMFGNSLIYYTVPMLQKKLVFKNIKFVSFGIGLAKVGYFMFY